MLCPCRARNTFLLAFEIAPFFCASPVFSVDLDVDFQANCPFSFTVLTEIRIYRQNSVQSPIIKSSKIPFSWPIFVIIVFIRRHKPIGIYEEERPIPSCTTLQQ
jgi:hypothetical protein